MKFGLLPLAEAEGAVLAHTLRAGRAVLKKGHRLSSGDLSMLGSAGLERVMAARLDSDDVDEDAAAATLARALAGPGVRVAAPKTGRANLYAEAQGIWIIDGPRVESINSVDEALTVATLPAGLPVTAGELVATVKVIPFAVARVTLERARAAAGSDAGAVHPFAPLRVGLLLTWLEGQPATRLDQGARAVGDRVRALGGTVVCERRVPHEGAAVAAAVKALLALEIDLLLVLGASAIVDRQDVIPSAIVACGGVVEHFGMPVDPGNLILVAAHDGRPVIGVPSCARSPKRSGFDMVLERIAAGLPCGRAEIVRMGVGGLLPEIASRPGPREGGGDAHDAGRRPRVAGLLLAAGSSRRMGERHKLLVPIEGEAMVARAARTLLDAGLSEVVVVTGHRAEEVRGALGGLDVRYVHNPEHARGLASSLVAGLRALADGADGVVVALGDMPWVRPETVVALVEAFDPDGDASICAPFFEGRRGNPVLWARRFFAELERSSGDAGGRELLVRHDEHIARVSVSDPGILWDVDTEEALSALLDTQTTRETR